MRYSGILMSPRKPSKLTEAFAQPTIVTQFLLLFLIAFLGSVTATAQIVSPIPEVGPGVPLAPAEDFEDLSTLSISGSRLVARLPILGEVLDAPTYTRELIRVQWRGGDPIDLYIILPKGITHPPGTLLLYSYPTDTDRFRNDSFCRNATRDGFAAVGFVSALTGQRYHDVPMKQWFVSKLPVVLPITVHDIQMVLNYLASRGDVDMNRVGIFGQGSGGTIAILAASVDSRLRAVDALDPWGDWTHWLAGSPQIPAEERAGFLTPEFLSKVAPFDPITFLREPATTSFRLEEALFNQAVPPAVRASFAATVAPSQRVSYTTVDEYKQRAAQDGALLSWLHHQLTSPRAKP